MKTKYVFEHLYKNGEQVVVWKQDKPLRYTKPFKYEIGYTTSKNEIIIDRWRGSRTENGTNDKHYTLKCNKCGAIYYRREGGIDKQRGCGCCCLAPQWCCSYTNSIAITAPWMIDLLLNKEDAYKYTKGSNIKILWKCHCGEITERSPKDVLDIRSLNCKVCSDGLSYSEKLMGNILRKLNVKYKKCQTSWSQGKEYDFFIEDMNIIFETHGIQHYESKARGRSLEQEQENDKFKEQLALDNGIKYYYQIDCRCSTLEWCRPNMEEALKNHFDLSVLTDEDWLEADKETLTSNMLKCCKLANNLTYNINGYIDTVGIANEMNLARKTVCDYLVRGTTYGLCEYNGQENAKLNAYAHLTGKGRYYIGIDFEGNIVHKLKRNEFKNERYYKMVNKVCNRENNIYDNLFWFKEEDYLQHIANRTLSLQPKERVAHNKGKKLVNGTYI